MNYTTTDQIRKANNADAPIEFYINSVSDYVTITEGSVVSMLRGNHKGLRISPYGQYAVDLIKADYSQYVADEYTNWITHTGNGSLCTTSVGLIKQPACLLTYFTDHYDSMKSEDKCDGDTAFLSSEEVAAIVRSYEFELLEETFCNAYQVSYGSSGVIRLIPALTTKEELHKFMLKCKVKVLEDKLTKANNSAIEQAKAVLSISDRLIELQQRHKADVDTFGKSLQELHKQNSTQACRIGDLKLALKNEQQKLAKSELSIKDKDKHTAILIKLLEDVLREYSVYKENYN